MLRSMFLTSSVISSNGSKALVIQARCMSSQKRICALIVGKFLKSLKGDHRHWILKFLCNIIGAPGSGKGTISNWIVRDFGLKHVSSGDLLRQNINEGTPLGKEAKAFMDKGELVPDEVMVNLVSSELKKLGEISWLLDGFPRTQPQAAALQAETPVNVVVNLDVPFDTIIGRVKG